MQRLPAAGGLGWVPAGLAAWPGKLWSWCQPAGDRGWGGEGSVLVSTSGQNQVLGSLAVGPEDPVVGVGPLVGEAAFQG